jgi:hypothetical protein
LDGDLQSDFLARLEMRLSQMELKRRTMCDETITLRRSGQFSKPSIRVKFPLDSTSSIYRLERTRDTSSSVSNSDVGLFLDHSDCSASARTLVQGLMKHSEGTYHLETALKSFGPLPPDGDPGIHTFPCSVCPFAGGRSHSLLEKSLEFEEPNQS